LADVISSEISNIRFPECLKDRYSGDKFFGKIVAHPKQFKNFVVHEGLVFLKDSDASLLCIPDIVLHSRRAREIVISHAHSLLAHLGSRKTLYYLRENVWWKS
ncbi:hypothetical protein BD410DRAFT_694070, partial [Rickenella mellea]